MFKKYFSFTSRIAKVEEKIKKSGSLTLCTVRRFLKNLFMRAGGYVQLSLQFKTLYTGFFV